MSKKKSAASQQTPPAKKIAANGRGKAKTVWIVAACVLVVAVGAVAASRAGKSSGTQSAAALSAEEAKYIGRYLPKGYVEPQIGEESAVSADAPMTPIEATTDDAGLSLPVADVSSERNVSFDYTKSDGSVVPMIAYMKPSGRLFVGVSYCVPCKGTGQTLTADGKLTCDSCGTKRDPESGVGISGACKLYPLDELPAKVAGDKIVVDKAALENWIVQPTDRPVGG